MVKPELWIGLVGIVPVNGNDALGQAAGGAYTIVLGHAMDVDDFTVKVTSDLKAQGYEIYEIEDVEPYSERTGNFEVTDEIRALAREAELTKEFQCGTLHAFPLKGSD